MLDAQFLGQLLERYKADSTHIYISDANMRILAATEEEKIGTIGHTAGYIISIRRPASINNNTGKDDMAEDVSSIYGAPIMDQDVLWGTVVVHGPASLAVQLGSVLQAALEAALTYQHYSQEQSVTPQNELEQAAFMMLSGHCDRDALLSLMYHHELEPSLLRTIISVRMHFHKNSYFNISLNLGYQSSIEELRHEIVRQLRKSRYLNTQDIVYLSNRNTISIIKTFLPTDALPRVYLALDEVCCNLVDTLKRFSAFSFGIAYGNLYQGIDMVYQSRLEAEETLDIGYRSDPDQVFYRLDNLLFENICRHLQPQIVDKLLNPAISQLRNKDHALLQELISSCEAYVDSCMNLSAASARTLLHRNTISARLEKLKLLTGLDPSRSFQDAFLLKMLAVCVRCDGDPPKLV